MYCLRILPFSYLEAVGDSEKSIKQLPCRASLEVRKQQTPSLSYYSNIPSLASHTNQTPLLLQIFHSDDSFSTDFDHASHPVSLPVLSGGHAHPSRRTAHSLPQTPQYGTPAKLQDSSQSSGYMLGNIMPFGNPSFTSQNRSGSDMCLNVPDGGREGQKNSTGGTTSLYVPNNVSELGWLDLDNTSSLGLSPTLQGSNFGNLNTHSNPGSLPHEQFQTAFENGMGVQVGVMEALAKNSNPAVNGFDLGGAALGGVARGGSNGEVIASFLEPGMMHQSGLYPSTEEEQLLELGLSR